MLGLVMTVSAVVNVLGVEQAAAGVAAHLLNVDPKLGFLASALFRVMAIVVVFVTGPGMAHWLSRRTGPAAKSEQAGAAAAVVGSTPAAESLLNGSAQ
jgi:hypothetical protein